MVRFWNALKSMLSAVTPRTPASTSFSIALKKYSKNAVFTVSLGTNAFMSWLIVTGRLLMATGNVCFKIPLRITISTEFAGTRFVVL